MKKQFTHRFTYYCVAILVLGVLGACAAPMPTQAPVSQTTRVITPTDIPISYLESRIIKPLIQDNDGMFEPGLAQSWSITNTADNDTYQAVFTLSRNWAPQNHNTLQIEDIAQGLSQLNDQLWQDPNAIAVINGAGVTGNPCIIPTPTPPSSPKTPGSIPRLQFDVSPIDSNDISTITLTYEGCTQYGTACKDNINTMAMAPLYDRNMLTLESRLDTGEFVFLSANSKERWKYNPETGVLDNCPECKPIDDPPICPTPRPRP